MAGRDKVAVREHRLRLETASTGLVVAEIRRSQVELRVTQALRRSGKGLEPLLKPALEDLAKMASEIDTALEFIKTVEV